MSSRALHDHLRSVPLFSGLDDRELDAVGQATTELQLPAGKALMHVGDPSREMFVIVDGTVSVRDGDREVAVVEAGGFVGEIGLLANTPRTFDVVATTTVDVLHVDGRRLDPLMHDVPTVATKLLAVMAERAAQNSQQHTD